MVRRYHELVGMKVVAVDGQSVGRLEDLIAEEREGTFRVTALLLGPEAIIYRFGLRWRPLTRLVERRTIPMELVDRVDTRVHLRVKPEELRGAAASVAMPTPAKAEEEHEHQ